MYFVVGSVYERKGFDAIKRLAQSRNRRVTDLYLSNIVALSVYSPRLTVTALNENIYLLPWENLAVYQAYASPEEGFWAVSSHRDPATGEVTVGHPNNKQPDPHSKPMSPCIALYGAHLTI